MSCRLNEDGKTVSFPFVYNDDDETLVCADRIIYFHSFTENCFQEELSIADEGSIGYPGVFGVSFGLSVPRSILGMGFAVDGGCEDGRVEITSN